DQIVAIFDLREEQPVGAYPALGGREEWHQDPQPLSGASLKIPRGERVGQPLESEGSTALKKSVRALTKADGLGLEPRGEPMMVVETKAGREREVRTDADEHASPIAIAQVEVVLRHPPAFVLQMPAVVFADGDKDAGGFARLQDDDDLVRLSPPEVGFDERLAPLAIGRLDNRGVPLRGTGGHPAFVLAGDVAEHGLTHGVELSVTIEEANDAFGLLKRLNEPIE